MTLFEQVAKSNCGDELCKEICEYLANPDSFKKPNIFCKSLRVDNGLLLEENMLWVPNNGEL